MAKPRAVLAFAPGLEAVLLPPSHMKVLQDIVDLPDTQPLGTFDDERATELLSDAEVILGGWMCPLIDAAVLKRAPNLQLIAYAAGTIKEVIGDAVWERGIRVTSAVAANAIPVAEFTLAAILLANKGAFWSNHRFHTEGFAAASVGWDVGNYNKQIGIIGASHVGRLVMEYLRPFALSVVVYDPYLSAEDAAKMGARKVELLELLSTSDVVSLHAPLLPETVGMIGAEQFAAMRDSTTFINTARGKIVDSVALEAAIETGRINAIIDTPDPEPLPNDTPLRGKENVFLTPHIAGSMGTEIQRMGDYTIAEIARWVKGEPLQYEVQRDNLGRIA